MKRINSILLIVGLLGSGIIPASLQAQEIGKGHQLMQAGAERTSAIKGIPLDA